MKLIFVGLHNKSPFKPLDVASASGKRLQMAIDLLDFGGQIIKTNLFDCEYLPVEPNDVLKHGDEWLQKYDPKKEDVIVLLGAAVKENFPATSSIIVKHGHPSPMFSKENGEQYALQLAIKINKSINKNSK